MTNSNTLSDKLIADFSREYIGKLFYFCLKKTGNAHEAEDLASDISLNIIAELKKGTIPENFPAWVWKIARNRYSSWADKKNRRAKAVSVADIESLELAFDGLVEDELLHKLLDAAREIAAAHYDFCRKIILDEVPEFLKNDSHQIDHACAAIYHMRGAVLEEALRTGYITYSDNDSRNMLGAYLFID